LDGPKAQADGQEDEATAPIVRPPQRCNGPRAEAAPRRRRQPIAADVGRWQAARRTSRKRTHPRTTRSRMPQGRRWKESRDGRRARQEAARQTAERRGDAEARMNARFNVSDQPRERDAVPTGISLRQETARWKAKSGGSAGARTNARRKASERPRECDAAPTQKPHSERPDSSGGTPRSRCPSVARAKIKLSGGV